MSDANWNIFKAVNPAEAAYLEANAKGNEFLTSLMTQAQNRGDLSPKQLECIQRNMPKGDDEQAANWATFTGAQPEVAEFLVTAKGEFLESLFAQAKNKGSLSVKQLAAAERAMDKAGERNGQWAMDRAKPVSINVKGIYDTFATMQANGLQRPKLRFDGFTLSLGKDGIVWVNGPQRETFGRIHCDGVFFASATCPAEITKALAEITDDVIGATKKYGHASGGCGVCGRALTNSVSIKMGIGPICAEKMGLDGVRHEEESKRNEMGAAEYLLEGGAKVEADLPETVPFPTPDDESAGIEHCEQIPLEAYAEEYDRQSNGW